MSGYLIISSRQNLKITAQQGFQQQGLKKRHQKKSAQVEPGDFFFYYITGVQKLAAMVQVKSFVREAEDRIWVNLGKEQDEVYPWRFIIAPSIILPESSWMDMIDFSGKLLHFRKWPARYWRLGLQGQIHSLRDDDTQLLIQAFENAAHLK